MISVFLYLATSGVIHETLISDIIQDVSNLERDMQAQTGSMVPEKTSVNANVKSLTISPVVAAADSSKVVSPVAAAADSNKVVQCPVDKPCPAPATAESAPAANHQVNEDMPSVDTSGKVLKLETVKQLRELMKSSEKDVVVMFFAPWCPHCKDMKPVFKEVGKKHPEVKMIMVNASKHKKFRSVYKIKGYPTIKYYPKHAEKSIGKYKQGSDINAMSKWIDMEKKTALSTSSLEKKTADLERDETSNIFQCPVES